MRVLDVGCGLGEPARTLAVEFGCHATVVDLADSYVEAGRMLTAPLHLDDHVAPGCRCRDRITATASRPDQ